MKQRIEEIEAIHQAQLKQVDEDFKAGKITFEEAKRIVLSDTANTVAQLRDLLPKEDKSK